MKNARRQRGVGSSRIRKLPRNASLSRAARRDDGNIYASETSRVNSISKPFFVPSAFIEVRRISPAPNSTPSLRPFESRPDSVSTRPPFKKTFQSVADSFRVNRQHDALRTEIFCRFGQNLRIFDRRSIYRNFVCARIQKNFDVFNRVDAAADGKRNIYFRRNFSDQVRSKFCAFRRSP